MVLVACKSLGISAIALRYQNVYGPGQSLVIHTQEFYLFFQQEY